MKILAHTIFLMITLAVLLPLRAQDSTLSSRQEIDKNLYEITLYKLKSHFPEQTRVDTIIPDLVKDAAELAEAGQWSEARELLAAAESLLQIDAEALPADSLAEAIEFSVKVNRDADNSFADKNIAAYFQIESGVDFSRQDYQIAIDDSALVEQLQSGFLNLDYYHPLKLGGQTALVNHSLRADNQYVSYAFQGNLEIQRDRLLQRFDVQSGFYLSQEKLFADFGESRLSYLLGRPYSLDTRWYVDARARTKWHPNPDSLNSDILTASLTGYIEHFFNFRQSINFSWTPSWYQERNGSQFQYWQQRAYGYYRLREGFNRYVELGAEFVQNNFRDDIQDTLYQNRYVSIEPQVQAEWTLNPRLGFKARLEWETRRYRVSDAVNPDFQNRKAEAVLRFYRSTFQSFGLGYVFEDQRHKVRKETDAAFAEEGDFFSHGLVVELEFLQLDGIMIDLSYQLSWRSYPNAVDSYFNAFYSDRLTHSINLFAWVPLTARWQVQLFANYDDDRDREFKQNDARSTIMNASLIYKF